MEPIHSRQTKQFETLTIPRKELTKVGMCYRVYETARDFKIVEAGTAMEALEACGLKSAYKIMREDVMNYSLLGSEVWELPEASHLLMTVDVAEAPEVTAEAGEAPPPVPVASSEPGA